MRNPLILWSLYLIPIFSKSEHIEQTPAINPCLSEPEEWTSQIFSDMLLWDGLIAPSSSELAWQKYFIGCQSVKLTVPKQKTYLNALRSLIFWVLFTAWRKRSGSADADLRLLGLTCVDWCDAELLKVAADYSDIEFLVGVLAFVTHYILYRHSVLAN